ncbi:predicted protein, partial [Nematostella vectensis]
IQLVCYSVIAGVSIFGNSLIWWKIHHRPRRRISDFFIINLSLSDILTGLLSIPLDLAERLSKGWPFWGFMCKIVYPLQTVLMAVTVLTLLGISAERYRAVITPMKRKPTRNTIISIICILWGISIVVAIPYMTVLKYDNMECYEVWSSRAHVAIYTVSIFVLLYVIPLTIITLCYVRIGLRLKQDMRSFRKIMARCSKNPHMTNVFALVVMVFAICQLPNHVIYLWHDLGRGGDWVYYSDVLPLCHILTYLNSALDPFALGML